MHSKWENIQNYAIRKLSSRGFLIFVIALFILQALWIAMSYRYPMIYDEAFHINVINLYSNQISPVITNQPTFYDMYGSLSHGVATLYHYLLSFPYRLISVITDNLAIHVVAMRVINITMAATGIYLFAELFKRVKFKQLYINVALLIFTLIPITTFVAATTNYDNMLFPLTVLFFILGVDIIQSKRVNTNNYIWLILLGCIASLVKFTFLPVFAVSVLFLSVYLYRMYSKNILKKIIESFKRNSKGRMYVFAALAIVIVGWFSSIYLYNIVAYKSLAPACEQVMSIDRCKEYSIGVRNNSAFATRDTRPLVAVPDYISLWLLQMASWSGMTGAHVPGQPAVTTDPMPIYYTTLTFGWIFGIAFLLYAWRSLDKNVGWYFLLSITVSMIGIVFIQNYHTYVQLHIPYAIQPRYILHFMPILIIMLAVATNYVMKSFNTWNKLAILIIYLLLFLQGGGIVPAILKSNDSWYWNNNIVRKMNHGAKKILFPLVKER